MTSVVGLHRAVAAAEEIDVLEELAGQRWQELMEEASAVAGRPSDEPVLAETGPPDDAPEPTASVDEPQPRHPSGEEYAEAAALVRHLLGAETVVSVPILRFPRREGLSGKPR